MLVSTTLTGNSEALITDALESVVAWVDRCIVIDTGITDDTLDMARRAVGDKLVVYQWPWRNDFAAARNYALQTAAQEGAEWALTVDSDERMVFRASFSRNELRTNGDMRVMFAYVMDQSYMKERFLRINSGVEWVGVAHEKCKDLPYDMKAATLNVAFTEVPKSHEQFRLKSERDVELLTEYVAQHPGEPRWLYYLGASLQNVQREEEAVPFYLLSAQLSGFREEGIIATFRAVQCLGKLLRWSEAVDLCVHGLQVNPAATELRHYLDMATHKAKLANSFDRPMGVAP